MGRFGTWEILLVALIFILFFGAKRIPQIARGLGEGIREFKGSMKGGEESDRQIEDGDDRDRS